MNHVHQKSGSLTSVHPESSSSKSVHQKSGSLKSVHWKPCSERCLSTKSLICGWPAQEHYVAPAIINWRPTLSALTSPPSPTSAPNPDPTATPTTLPNPDLTFPPPFSAKLGSNNSAQSKSNDDSNAARHQNQALRNCWSSVPSKAPVQVRRRQNLGSCLPSLET
jgi:hypothetical protein